MPPVARRASVDDVWSPDGTGICCVDPTIQTTDEGSETVFINEIGAVRIGDRMITHLYPGPCCTPHAPPLVQASPTVFVEGRALGRIGDVYDDGSGAHIIQTGSPTVFAN